MTSPYDIASFGKLNVLSQVARRIAQIYQEAGDMYAVRDFRRVTDQLEAAENFGEFLRALLRE